MQLGMNTKEGNGTVLSCVGAGGSMDWLLAEVRVDFSIVSLSFCECINITYM